MPNLTIEQERYFIEMSALKFDIQYEDPNSLARIGRLETLHGVVETPTFIPVGTQATVKTMKPGDINALDIPMIICNTYHLHLRPGADLVAEMGGLQKFMGWDGVTMTDSGGFQVFSLGASIEHGVGKVASIFPGDEGKKLDRHTPKGQSRVKLTEEGAHFRSHIDGSKHLFTPENTIDIQHKLGSDIILVLDECTSPFHDYEYTSNSLELTHRWAKRALKHFQSLNIKDQSIYGIIQGGALEDLREKSATFIGEMDFHGIGIGGTLGESKSDIYRVLDWTTPFLPREKPRHLLGIGEIDNIFDIVERGVDTFDCVTPTRYGRYGNALLKGENKYRLDVTAAKCKKDPNPINPECECTTCKTHSRAYLNHLFHAKEPLAGHLVTIHNLYTLMNLMKDVRKAIADGTLNDLKAQWLVD